MAAQEVKAIMVAEQGKWPQVQRCRNSWQLKVTDDEFGNEKEVTIYKFIQDSSVRMAFCFPHKRKSYVMKVVGNAVKLEENKGIEKMSIDNSKLFQMKGTMVDTWNLVESVAQSGMYLRINESKTVSLSSDIANCTRFRLDEEHEKES